MAKLPVLDEAIILAGGLGTRLQASVPDVPKCLAPINGRPFIDYLIDFLIAQQIRRFIFSLGYRHEMIIDHIQSYYPNMDSVFVIEASPLGTGGAIRLSAENALQEDVVIVNGDTLYKTDLAEMLSLQVEKKADCTLALKPMKNFERYGSVELATDLRIIQFHEKKKRTDGLINGGVYLLHVPAFLKHPWPEKFSFEKDFLEVKKNEWKLYGAVQDKYFIDIGIPEDFQRASLELKN